MTAPADHAALRAEVDAARDAEREAFNRMWKAMNAAEDVWQAAYDAWRDAAAESAWLMGYGPKPAERRGN